MVAYFFMLSSENHENRSDLSSRPVCMVETFLSGERGKDLKRIMFNLLPNVQNPACQGGLTAFLMPCIIGLFVRFANF